MNDELITLNEIQNEGNRIYFYKDEILGVWTTWGYSSYNLAHMVGIKYVASFSEKMQMPCACITEGCFREIINNNIQFTEYKDGSYSLTIEKSINPNLYRDWVMSLK